MGNRIELDPNTLENVSGGALGYDPDQYGTYTMNCQFSGKKYYRITLEQIIEIAKFSATIPNTPEGEVQILAWAHAKHFI